MLGEKTFGEGSVQKVIEMPDGAALILSVAKYHSPSGKSIQDDAVTPNITVAQEPDFGIDEDETPQTPETNPQNAPDEQLRRAIEVLKNRPS